MRYQALSLAILGLGKSYAAHFSDTCNSFDLRGSLLMAKCSKSPNGYYYDTVVDLNKCVGNKDGVLIRGENVLGNMECSICLSIGTQIRCMCYGRKGVLAPSSVLDLDDFISNQGGTLTCDQEVQVAPR
ncbi:hypothetical protein BDV39DRAFT_73797 [Aspergillus sergii]|uniref:Cyanovirin-N domain-containing protein n=1 Tax=Aspergillus sergii TaxID=1034303 RepID=A0A5N6XLG4_9EURO|nr:hypothetical protein BDV39DRAFT_73797 [Aspergillus sergii]